MDTSKRLENAPSVLPTGNSKRRQHGLALGKDKKYVQQIEKTLASFDSLEEWADYIAFLSRLQKSLQINEESVTPNSLDGIVHAQEVANRLSLCLSPKLPNGVHQKALSIYEAILAALNTTLLNEEISIWILGLLPVLSFCSIQIKPHLLRIYKHHIISPLYPSKLRALTKSLILSLLPGLDDENSELFAGLIDILDSLKKKLNDDAHFWQCMFLCIITNPEKRLGALNWCNKRLPSFHKIKNDESLRFSEEAHACLTPESGLVVRAFATSINTCTSFNPANDIVIIRGFFDLLLSHLPLDSEVLNTVISTRDKELLIQACFQVTLKRDMSLNRRLWNWLLGPDLEPQNTDSYDKSFRAEYFRNYGLDSLVSVILSVINDKQDFSDKKIDMFKVASSLVMDKWELSHLISPKVLLPILEATYYTFDVQNYSDYSNELLLSAQSFFNVVEAATIWHDLFFILLEGTDEKLSLIGFVLQNFDFNEDEMTTIHIPLNALVILSRNDIDLKRLTILKSLLEMTSQKKLPAPVQLEDVEGYNSAKIFDLAKSFYGFNENDETKELPFSLENMWYLILKNLERHFIDNLFKESYCFQYCELYCDQLYSYRGEFDGKQTYGGELKNKLLELPVTTPESDENVAQVNLSLAFTHTMILNRMAHSFTSREKDRLIKKLLNNLWTALVSPYPANYQLEAVKCVFELGISCSSYLISAGISRLMIESGFNQSLRALETLWNHSSAHGDVDSILERPTYLILDELLEQDNVNVMSVTDFLYDIIRNGASKRLLRIIFSPLLRFELLHESKSEITKNDELQQFNYYLNIISGLLGNLGKEMKEVLSNDFVNIEDPKFEALKFEESKITTYKSLISNIIERYLSLEVSPEMRNDSEGIESHRFCVKSCLDIYKMITTGNETNFTEKFQFLVEKCMYYIEFPNEKAYAIEAIQTCFIDCLLHHMDLSKKLKMGLNLLHVEEEGHTPPFVKFMILGIRNSRSILLLRKWVYILIQSLYSFNESLFSVLLLLTDVLIKKIESCFDDFVKYTEFDNSDNLESSISALLSGLEDLLSISHGYLVSSKARSDADSLNSHTNESGFLGNVILGVFQLESPSYRTTEENKFYSVILSIQDTVKVSFKLWSWSDSNPTVSGNKRIATKSFYYLGSKLKFRAKKLLDSLIEVERGEVVEAIIAASEDLTKRVKLLQILDGGRSQITIPYIVNSISSRRYPSMVEDNFKSLLITEVSPSEIFTFFIAYLESSDNDSILEAWNSIIQFLRDVCYNSSSFKEDLPDLLTVMKTLSLKLNVHKFKEHKRNKREIADLFVKLLSLALNPKHAKISLKEDDNSLSEEEKTDDDRLNSNSQQKTLNLLLDIIEHLEEIIQDSDKVTSCVGTIINLLILPLTKSKKPDEIALAIQMLLEAIGKFHPVKMWRTLVADIFMDNNFFVLGCSESNRWRQVINLWIAKERGKLNDFIVKVTPSVQSSAGNIFIWNESSELENKVFTLKRISFILLTQPDDFFLTLLDDLMERISYSLENACPMSYRSEILNLLRAITLKFSEIHLLPYWIYVSQELSRTFTSIKEKSSKDLSLLAQDELNLILASCKLLDQCLLLKYDEFNLQDWLFVSSSSEIVSKGIDNSTIAKIDQIANTNDLSFSKEPAIRLELQSASLCPLLAGVRTINSVASLRSFFNSLSLLNYERTYNLYKIDRKACEEDIFNDLTI